jgi:hypothetical protein
MSSLQHLGDARGSQHKNTLHVISITSLLCRLVWLFVVAVPLVPGIGHAQLVTKGNSLASYTYDAAYASVLGEPLTPAAGTQSMISFFPAFSVDSVSDGPPVSNNIAQNLSFDIAASPGYWFDGSALSMKLNGKLNYNLAAPVVGSAASVSFAAPLTLDVTGVDGSPFSSLALPYDDAMIVNPSLVSVTGPVGFSSGNITGSITLDISTIKLHFGIGAGQNVTALRLSVGPSLTVSSQAGSAQAALVNFDVVNQVVPEPSTYAFLMLGSVAGGFALWRRRRS